MAGLVFRDATVVDGSGAGATARTSWSVTA